MSCERWENVAMGRASGATRRMRWLLRALPILAMIWPSCAIVDTCDVCGSRPLALDEGEQPQLLGGVDASPGSWPWMVSLQLPTLTGHNHTCGGSLITARWVLTAAHCFRNKRNLPHWRAVVGATQLSSLGSEVHVRFIKQVVIHEDYKPGAEVNDIALMELDQPVQCSDYIQPACLPDSTVKVPTLTDCYIGGWGVLRKRATKMLDVMQEAKVDRFPVEQCNSTSWYKGKIQEHNLCAGYEKAGINSCQGDSGGPLMCKEEGSQPFWVIGVTSWSRGCGKARKPIVYTATQPFFSWVNGWASPMPQPPPTPETTTPATAPPPTLTHSKPTESTGLPETPTSEPATATEPEQEISPETQAPPLPETNPPAPPETQASPPPETHIPPETHLPPPPETHIPPETHLPPPPETQVPPETHLPPPPETHVPPETHPPPPPETHAPPETHPPPPPETHAPPETHLPPPPETHVPPETHTSLMPQAPPSLPLETQAPFPPETPSSPPPPSIPQPPPQPETEAPPPTQPPLQTAATASPAPQGSSQASPGPSPPPVTEALPQTPPEAPPGAESEGTPPPPTPQPMPEFSPHPGATILIIEPAPAQPQPETSPPPETTTTTTTNSSTLAPPAPSSAPPETTGPPAQNQSEPGKETNGTVATFFKLLQNFLRHTRKGKGDVWPKLTEVELIEEVNVAPLEESTQLPAETATRPCLQTETAAPSAESKCVTRDAEAS